MGGGALATTTDPGMLRNRFLSDLWALSTPVHDPGALPVSLPADDVKNWMHMFRWIVKAIRDAATSTRWTRMKGLYKRPEFISAGFEQTCRAANAGCG